MLCLVLLVRDDITKTVRGYIQRREYDRNRLTISISFFCNGWRVHPSVRYGLSIGSVLSHTIEPHIQSYTDRATHT